MIDLAAELCIGCGLALVFHFDAHNRKVSCEDARAAAQQAFDAALREPEPPAPRPPVAPFRLIRGGKA